MRPYEQPTVFPQFAKVVGFEPTSHDFGDRLAHQCAPSYVENLGVAPSPYGLQPHASTELAYSPCWLER